MIRLYKLPTTLHLGNRGLREMEEKDVAGVTALYNKNTQRFGLVHVMTEDDVRHHFLSGRGKGEVKDGRREGQVVWSYVVEVRLGSALFLLPLF